MYHLKLTWSYKLIGVTQLCLHYCMVCPIYCMLVPGTAISLVDNSRSLSLSNWLSHDVLLRGHLVKLGSDLVANETSKQDIHVQ